MSLSPTLVGAALSILEPKGAKSWTVGMAISKPILEQTLEEYDKQMSVNGL